VSGRWNDLDKTVHVYADEKGTDGMGYRHDYGNRLMRLSGEADESVDRCASE